MNFVLLGPPGAGKGTQAKLIVGKFEIVHLSTGDMFREAKKSDEALKALLSTGHLVPDEAVINMVKRRLANDDVNKGFLLDGFPRTLKQARELDAMLKEEKKELTAVFFIYIDNEEATKRIAGRRVCSCGASYHIDTHPSKENGKCDYCGEVLIHRDDDKEDVVRERLVVYENQTKPLIDYYKNNGLLVEIDGFQDESGVFRQISNFIKSRR